MMRVIVPQWLILLAGCLFCPSVCASSINEKANHLDQIDFQITPDLIKQLNLKSELKNRAGETVFKSRVEGHCRLELLCWFGVDFPAEIENYWYFHESLAVIMNEKIKLFFNNKVYFSSIGEPMRRRFYLGRDKLEGARLYLFYIHYEDLEEDSIYLEGGLSRARIRIYQLDLATLLTPEKMRPLRNRFEQ